MGTNDIGEQLAAAIETNIGAEAIIADALAMTEAVNHRTIPESGPGGGIAQLLAILRAHPTAALVEHDRALTAERDALKSRDEGRQTRIRELLLERDALRSRLAASQRLGISAVFLADAIGSDEVAAEQRAYDEALTAPLAAERDGLLAQVAAVRAVVEDNGIPDEVHGDIWIPIEDLEAILAQPSATTPAATEARAVETREQIRNRLVPVVLSYAAAEHLTELGAIQAALRFGIDAGINRAEGASE